MLLLRYIPFLLLPLWAAGAEWNMVAIRDLYYQAAASKADSDKFKAALNAIPNPNTSIKGYIAVSHMIEAKHLFNPTSKLSAFNNGKTLLENTIKNDPENLELRFLRIGVQTNTPSFLGYSSQIEGDKKMILSKYALLTDADLKRRVRDFMLTAGICTEAEKQLLNP